MGNNSYILETQHNYRGVMIEYLSHFENKYKIVRPRSIYKIGDAQKIDYKYILDENNFPKEMDYLQIDLDVDNRSTLNTLELLNSTVFDTYKFATVTFEHDIYRGNFFDTQTKSREIFKNRGYVLVFPDVSVFWQNKWCKYEDWYAHPDLIDTDIINKIKSDVSLTHEEVVNRLDTI